MIKAIRFALFAMVSSLVALTATAATPTKAEAQALVEKAIAFASSNGKDKLLAEVNKKNGTFDQGELYVFVYDLKGTLVANPNNKEQLGQNNLSQPDAEGKLFRKEFIETAKSSGSGWVDYKYKNPSSGALQAKTSYVKKHGDLVIIAGVYLK